MESSLPDFTSSDATVGSGFSIVRVADISLFSGLPFGLAALEEPSARVSSSAEEEESSLSVDGSRISGIPFRLEVPFSLPDRATVLAFVLVGILGVIECCLSERYSSSITKT